jgi:hypothetical protein
MGLVGGLVRGTLGVWTLLDETDPALFDKADVLDDPS